MLTVKWSAAERGFIDCRLKARSEVPGITLAVFAICRIHQLNHLPIVVEIWTLYEFVAQSTLALIIFEYIQAIWSTICSFDVLRCNGFLFVSVSSGIHSSFFIHCSLDHCLAPTSCPHWWASASLQLHLLLPEVHVARSCAASPSCASD